MSGHRHRIVVRGKPFRLCAAMVNTRHDGAPSNLTLLPPQHSVSLAGGEEFITLYVPESVLPRDWDTKKGGGK